MDIDFLTLADGAQVVGDKLYMLGGGWNLVKVPRFPAQHAMAIAVGISVDWAETNLRHTFKIELRKEDRAQTLAAVAGQFEAGRPAGIQAGTTQKVLMAFSVSVLLENPGQFSVHLFLNDRDEKRQEFHVMPSGGELPPSEAPQI